MPRKRRSKSYVYFLQNNNTDLVKIGVTTNIKVRYENLKRAYVYVGDDPPDLNYIRIVKGTRITEQWLHNKFAYAKYRAEWFNFEPEMLTIEIPDEPPSTTTLEQIKDPELTMTEVLDMKVATEGPLHHFEFACIKCNTYVHIYGFTPKKALCSRCGLL